MGTNRKMTAEVLSQQPGVVAVFVSQCGEHGPATDAWRATAARMFITASERGWSNVVMHIDGGRTLHLLREQGESIIVVMVTGCKFAKNVARSMRRALDTATQFREKVEAAAEALGSTLQPVANAVRMVANSSRGSSW